MPDQEQEYQYDLFLSHASEDNVWCEKLAKRLRDQGVRVWFDVWELQPGDNLLARINDGLKSSRKMVAVFSSDYFNDGKVWTRAESYALQAPDILSKDRPVIPIWIKNLQEDEIEPTLRPILYLDFRNDEDFDLRLRQLIEALDLPRREFARQEEIEFREHRLDPAEHGGSDDQTVRLWEISSGQLLKTLNEHLGSVWAVAFAPNNRYLVTGGSGRCLQFWDVSTGMNFLRRYYFGYRSWLDLLPDGRFDASPEGIRYLGYTEEGTFNQYTAESLVKEFYAPDAVREVLEKYTK